MSQDHREAKIFVHFEDDLIKRKKLLDQKKHEISQAINRLISMKYPPRIKIEGVDDETVNL
jgi:ribosome-binding factor A